MDFLRRIAEFGRLKGAPKDQNAGRALGPSSTQRTQLGLKEVAAPKGVVRLRSGEVRAFLKVTGFSAHVRDEAQARVWLQGYARALNTLPGNAVLLVRSRPGGLDRHIRRQEERVAQYQAGTAMAKLAGDQLAHAQHMAAEGQTRQTDQFVALHSPRGDVIRLLSARDACRRHLEAAGVKAEPVNDQLLVQYLSEGWHPALSYPETFVQDFGWHFPASGVYSATLRYAPKGSCVDEPLPPAPKATIAESGR